MSIAGRFSRSRRRWTHIVCTISLSAIFTSSLLCLVLAAPAALAANSGKPAGGSVAAVQFSPPAINVHPVARVVNPIDNSKRTTLYGQTPSVIKNAADLGRLAASTQLQHMIMVLRASTDQDHALVTLIDQQLDNGHPNFHHWLTPDEFGSALGVADADISQVTDWLASQGFSVEQVAAGKRFIQFSGTSGQVESAFQTQMHSYNVGGQTHISNASDISVPDALSPVIVGVPTLNDFFKTSNMKNVRKATVPMTSLTGTAPMLQPSGVSFSVPDYTGGTTHYVGAGDFALIYNTLPLLTAGNDGTGVTIGIIGRTDIALADVQIYRQFFNLKNNDPIFVVAGEDPGLVPGDDSESDLDVEVSGGAAPGATVEFITSRATLVTDGVDLSAMYAVQNNLTDIISESYGQCEANFGPVQAAFYENLWGQAAAQGQSVFVSSGDNGPASCDAPFSSNTAVYGYAVSLLASSPFNVAVGGTIFADTTGGPWWGTTATPSPPFTSALGYIPETPWNEARGSGATGAADLAAGSGGISAYFGTPSWQQGFGVPVTDPAYLNASSLYTPSSPASAFVPGPHRYMPDVAVAAAAQHDPTLFCSEGICQLSSTNTIVNAGLVGGTSVAAPSMAGVQALINQYNGGRQGQPNYVYYALANAQALAGLNCASNNSPNSNCAFHDITTGNNEVYGCGTSTCTTSTNSTTAPTVVKFGWTAAPGYDLATGLGSPNAYALATNWASVTFRSTTTTLNLSQTSGLTHGQSVTASGTVAPGSGSGVPTGQVAFLVSTGALGDPVDPNTGGFLNNVPLATLDASGNYTIDLTNLPAGTYNVIARYGGDGTFAASTSAPQQVTVSQETSTVTVSPNFFDGSACTETPQTTFTYGSYVWTDVTVVGSSGQGVPTGTVSITDNGNPLTTTSLNASGVAHFLSGAIPTTSCVYLYTFQDTAPLTVGTHALGASYSGDTSFAPSTATPVTVTITPATITGTLVSGASNIASGDPVLLSFTLAGLSGAGPGTLNPTGTVTFTDTTTSTVLGTATLSPTSTFGGVATVSTTGIAGAAGAHAIQASWPGDTNYNGVNSAIVNVTVQAGTATSVVVTSNGNPAAVGGRPTFTATMTPTTVTTGTVRFFDTFNGVTVSLGTGTVGAAHTATYRPAASVNLPAGTHQITAAYAGTATFNDSTSAAFAQTFNPAATTIQLTVLGTGACSQQFSLQASLGLAGTTTPAPTGTITFLDGGNPIASAPFSIVPAAQGGYAIFTAQTQVTVAPGSHTITATLSDPNYTAPVSNTQTVNSSCTAPTIASVFSPMSIALGATSTLSFTISNPNVGPLTGVAFNDTLPSGLAVASPSNLSNTCGGSLLVNAGAGTLSLSGGSIASTSQCGISINVQGTAAGLQTNTTSVVSATDGGAGNSTTASVLVIAPPTLAEAFGVSSMPLGATTNLQFTVTNPNATAPLTGVGFSDTLPPGLVIATPNGLSSGAGDCQSSGGTVTATAGGTSISLGGVTLTATDSCTFSLLVTGIQSGVQDNVTGNTTSNEGGTGAGASASVDVFVPTSLSGLGTATPNSAIAGGSTHLNVAVTGGTNPASSGITVTADLSGIGGVNPTAFTDNGDGTFGFNATVGAAVAPGPVSIPVNISDAQGRTATTAIAFTVLAPGALSGYGVATPAAPSGQTMLVVTVLPGTNPDSSGVTVVADLSSIGGSNSQALTGTGNTFSYQATVPLGTTPGNYSLPVTISDAQSRTASISIALTVLAPGPLSGSGLAVPATAPLAGTATLLVAVVPGTGPASTGISVTVDLSSIGGSATQQFYDDGSNGDQNAGDGIYTFVAPIPVQTPLGLKTLPVTIGDAQSRTATATIQVTIVQGDDEIFADGFE